MRRRFTREEEAGDEHRGRHHHQHQEPRDSWHGASDPATEAGVYDDHGRTSAMSPVEQALHQRHFDASA